jgi:hypothetical protein
VRAKGRKDCCRSRHFSGAGEEGREQHHGCEPDYRKERNQGDDKHDDDFESAEFFDFDHNDNDDEPKSESIS